MKSKVMGHITEETLFILLDIYKWAHACFLLAFGIRTLNIPWTLFGPCVTVSLQPRLLCQHNVQSSHAGCACDHTATEELHLRVKLDIQWHGEPRAIVPAWQCDCLYLTVCWLADKWLCGWISRRGSALWESTQREDPQSTKPEKSLWRAFERQPFRKCLVLWCV